MKLVTISLKDEITDHHKVKKLIKNRKLSSTINRLLKRYIRLEESEDKPIEKPYIPIQKQEYRILMYMLDSKINNMDTKILAKRIYDKGLFRQKKRIHDSVRRIINETGIYTVDKGILTIQLIDCSCGAKISPFALKAGKCVKCNRLLLGIGEY